MPLRWSTITGPSRIMLPAYPLFAAWQGIGYIVGDPARTSGPSLDFARDRLPIHAWGVIFLAIAVTLVAGYAMHSRDVTIFVLYVGAMAYAIWAVCFVAGMLTVPEASIVAPAWPAIVCCAFIASARSVSEMGH